MAATRSYPWWAYPVAAAASVVIAFLVWWGNSDRPVGVVYHPPVFENVYDQPPGAPYDAEEVAASWGLTPPAESAESTGAASRAADRAETLEDLGAFALIDPSDSNVLMLFDGDAPEPSFNEDELDVQ